ncbi:MAG: HAMP domain-containing protein [Planctomycetaceae bacterium]|nr:HAMP domain-containing protein [Planctomycetaceae bacterium]
MSYRAVKRLLGETSLERKCRFLFGSSLMALITGSFYFYAQLNLRIIRDQNQKQASLLVAPRLLAEHSLHAGLDEQYQPIFRELAGSTQTVPDVIGDYRFNLFQVPDLDSLEPGDDIPDLIRRPSDRAEYQAIEELVKRYRAHRKRGDTAPLEKVVEKPETDEFQYYRVVLATKSCVKCHAERQNNAQLKEGDMLGVAYISIPLSKTNRDVKLNNAILIIIALVTASLAMAAQYAIVRSVIVKPLLHLTDVSDAIAHGELDQRADIRTGDEFEELSHAFNRMLRHLVTVQDELKDVNNDLDSKVDELARANLSLHEMNKIKSEFLATMSHELRTPLNSILGFSDVLTSAENLSPKQRQFLRNITTSGQQLLTLINDILDLAKIEAGKMDLHLVEFSVADLVERQTLHMRPLSEKKNIELRWEVDEGLPLAFQDAGKLQQILNNLLSNAVKFTPEGGRIYVQALRETAEPETPQGLSDSHDGGMTETGDWLLLTVADTGVGIPLDDQELVFEKFRQGRMLPDRDALTREHEGTGLGLSIVKELSRLLKGEVTLISEFGKGSTFTVRIPLRLQPSLSQSEDSLKYQTVEFRRGLTRSDGGAPKSPSAAPPAALDAG